MTSPRVRAPIELAPFSDAFAEIRREFEVPAEFSPECQMEARAVRERGPATPPGADSARQDRRDVPFVTIDPPGTRDLDQALSIERQGDGHRVWYAIADVAAFVAPGSAMDRESFRRGVTVYLPDGRAPMLPDALTIDAASLLPDEERPAIVWSFDLDRDGAVVTTHVERAVVRSRAAFDYASVQKDLDAGRADPQFVLLQTIGQQRIEAERARGGVSLDLPTQEVVALPTGGFALTYEAPLPVERWNAQVSLMTGMAAAALMVDAHLGIVRTVPAPAPSQLERLRRTARALRIPWPDAATWGDVVRALDPSRSTDAAFLIQAAHVLRGAGYAVLDAVNTATPSTVPQHAGVAAPYAHVTAPLRRLVDRYANEIVVAHAEGREPPAWARDALPLVVSAMERATARAAAVDRAVIDAVECAVMQDRVGEVFSGVVIDRNHDGGIVQLRDPAVIASVHADVGLGSEVSARVASVDPVRRHIDLDLVRR